MYEYTSIHTCIHRYITPHVYSLTDEFEHHHYQHLQYIHHMIMIPARKKQQPYFWHPPYWIAAGPSQPILFSPWITQI